MKKFIMCAAVLLVPSVANASDVVGVHNKDDIRLSFDKDGTYALRVLPDFIYTDNVKGGLREAILRFGPSYRPCRWFTLGLHGYTSISGAEDGRVELQADFTLPLEFVTINDRNRLGYRFLNSAAGDRDQYANEFRVNITQFNKIFYPYVSDEPFVDLSKGTLAQNRFTVGAAYNVTDRYRLDLGYMLRSNNLGYSWGQEHFIVVGVNVIK